MAMDGALLNLGVNFVSVLSKFRWEEFLELSMSIPGGLAAASADLTRAINWIGSAMTASERIAELRSFYSKTLITIANLTFATLGQRITMLTLELSLESRVATQEMWQHLIEIYSRTSISVNFTVQLCQEISSYISGRRVGLSGQQVRVSLVGSFGGYLPYYIQFATAVMGHANILTQPPIRSKCINANFFFFSFFLAITPDAKICGDWQVCS
jgi:hypothetical protein